MPALGFGCDCRERDDVRFTASPNKFQNQSFSRLLLHAVGHRRGLGARYFGSIYFEDAVSCYDAGKCGRKTRLNALNDDGLQRGIEETVSVNSGGEAKCAPCLVCGSGAKRVKKRKRENGAASNVEGHL